MTSCVDSEQSIFKLFPKIRTLASDFEVRANGNVHDPLYQCAQSLLVGHDYSAQATLGTCSVPILP